MGRSSGSPGAGLGAGVGEYQALVRRALGRGEQALAERGDAQLAARVELDDAEDHRGLAVIQEVPVVDVEELEQRRRVVDAVADRGDELTDLPRRSAWGTSRVRCSRSTRDERPWRTLAMVEASLEGEGFGY